MHNENSYPESILTEYITHTLKLQDVKYILRLVLDF